MGGPSNQPEERGDSIPEGLTPPAQ
jgi:hypothetical protein